MIYNETEITVDEVAKLLDVIASPRILEIGAHDGETTESFLAAIPDCYVVAYEPDPRPIDRFIKRIGPNPRVLFRQYAVGSVTGHVPWFSSHGDIPESKHCYNHDWDLSSSMRKPTLHLQRSPEISFSEDIHVGCVRLDDDALMIAIARYDFAWIDAQGAQRDIIDGGRETLDATSYIYIELHHAPMYDGEPTFDELCTLLPNHIPVSKYGENYLLQKSGTT